MKQLRLSLYKTACRCGRPTSETLDRAWERFRKGQQQQRVTVGHRFRRGRDERLERAGWHRAAPGAAERGRRKGRGDPDPSPNARRPGCQGPTGRSSVSRPGWSPERRAAGRGRLPPSLPAGPFSPAGASPQGPARGKRPPAPPRYLQRRPAQKGPGVRHDVLHRRHLGPRRIRGPAPRHAGSGSVCGAVMHAGTGAVSLPWCTPEAVVPSGPVRSCPVTHFRAPSQVGSRCHMTAIAAGSGGEAVAGKCGGGWGWGYGAGGAGGSWLGSLRPGPARPGSPPRPRASWSGECRARAGRGAPLGHGGSPQPSRPRWRVAGGSGPPGCGRLLGRCPGPLTRLSWARAQSGPGGRLSSG